MTDRQAVLLVDDHPIVRHGLTQLLAGEPDLYVCGEAADAGAALEIARRERPALVLIDLSLAGTPSVEPIRRMRQADAKLRLLVVSMHDEASWAARALDAGACGYVMKQEDARTLLGRVRQALRGETAVSAAVASALLKRLTWDRTAAEPAPPQSLGDREHQVLRLIGLGRSNQEIATELQISARTVDAHRQHIRKKLGLRSAADLIRYAALRSEHG